MIKKEFEARVIKYQVRIWNFSVGVDNTDFSTILIWNRQPLLDKLQEVRGTLSRACAVPWVALKSDLSPAAQSTHADLRVLITIWLCRFLFNHELESRTKAFTSGHHWSRWTNVAILILRGQDRRNR